MFKVVLGKARETKRTVRYENDNDGCAVPVLYIQKSALPTPYPESVIIEVKSPSEG